MNYHRLFRSDDARRIRVALVGVGDFGATLLDQAQNIDRIYDRMREIAPTRTTAEWETILLDIDVPHTAFAKLSDIADQPHLRAVDLFQEVEHPSEGTLLQARPPARFS